MVTKITTNQGAASEATLNSHCSIKRVSDLGIGFYPNLHDKDNTFFYENKFYEKKRLAALLVFDGPEVDRKIAVLCLVVRECILVYWLQV